jgi:hypothetical protein
VVDSYYPVSPDLILLIVGLKNVFGFGFSYAIIPWINAVGFKRLYGTLAGIEYAVILLGLPLWYFGKQIRHITGAWKIILIQ